MDSVTWKTDIRRPLSWTHIGFGPDLVVTPARRSDIDRMLAAGEDEPLHQSLLREAESLIASNPRSALTIGATAAEVAVKALVATLAPPTSWLVWNLPSPPIAKILEEYLPILLPEGSPKLPPELLKQMKAAVTLRNELVHGSLKAVDRARVASAFNAFRDVAWLCDHFAGVAWAVNRVSAETREAMDLPTSVDTRGWFVD